jgi:hypothetical protein
MTTERNAQGVDGLAEVMGLIRKADFREVRWGWRDDKDAPGSLFHEPRHGHAYALAMCPRYGKDDWEKNAKALAAAVNYLRSHGEAIRELVEADREYDEARAAYSAKAPCGIGESDSRTDDDYAPLGAAIARRRAALAKFSEPRP